MNKFLTIINYRTAIALSFAILMLFFSFTYNISYNIDLTLLSIAIIFPLVFNIRGSFRRREKALEHLSQFRGALKTISYYFQSAPKLTETEQTEVAAKLKLISESVVSHLGNSDYDTSDIDEKINQISAYTISKDTLISRGLKDKIFRMLNSLHEAIENVHAIHVHRTPVSLKAYCEYFIYAFPIIYVSAIIYKVGLDSPKWITVLVVLFSQFILISLYNIQDDLEYPFDNIGLDDINLNQFKLDR